MWFLVLQSSVDLFGFLFLVRSIILTIRINPGCTKSTEADVVFGNLGWGRVEKRAMGCETASVQAWNFSVMLFPPLFVLAYFFIILFINNIVLLQLLVIAILPNLDLVLGSWRISWCSSIGINCYQLLNHHFEALFLVTPQACKPDSW